MWQLYLVEFLAVALVLGVVLTTPLISAFSAGLVAWVNRNRIVRWWRKRGRHDLE